MAAPVSKTKKIELLVKLVQKRCKGIAPPQERPVLEGLIYAALLENAAQNQADEAFAVLENYFVDWNEARVALPQELADIFPMLPEPLQAGERVRYILQSVFERTFQFDLEDIPKKNKNLSQAVEFFETLPGCSRFMTDVITQTVLGGHTIPLDEAALRVFRLLGLTQVNDNKTKEFVPGIERAISKKSGITVFYQLHHFAAGYFNDPESAELRQILKTLDSEVLSRSWVKPVLVVPKIQEKSHYVPPVKLPVERLPISFGGDEDDFDEESSGVEKILAGENTEDGVFDTRSGSTKLGTSKIKQTAEKSKSGQKGAPGKKTTEQKPAIERSKEKNGTKKAVKKENAGEKQKKTEKKKPTPAPEKNSRKPSNVSSKKSTEKQPVKKQKKK
ncbi:hypothetical protein FACS18942_01280 [Planctomycetales bacterium]|nr:hypothetical protein FACS18942_01280 [Planctomycetales bacterium]